MSNLVELRAIAKTMGIKGYSVLKKADLIQSIENSKKPVAIEVQVQAEKPVDEKSVEKKPVDEKPAKAPRKNNDWNSFLSDYRKTHNVTLRQAMASAKEEYAKLKDSKKAD